MVFVILNQSSVVSDSTISTMGDMRGWINTEFSKPGHCGMFYSRIMYDRHHV